jgi:hypothetical protein
MTRCAARNEGDWVKNTEKAPKAISSMEYDTLAPVRVTAPKAVANVSRNLAID